MLKIDGKEIPHNALIRWCSWDGEEFKDWVMTGIYKAPRQLTEPFKNDIEPYIVYLGGGLDFGSAVGKAMCWSEVVDSYEGLSIIGKASDINFYIQDYKGENN